MSMIVSNDFEVFASYKNLLENCPNFVLFLALAILYIRLMAKYGLMTNS